MINKNLVGSALMMIILSISSVNAFNFDYTSHKPYKFVEDVFKKEQKIKDKEIVRKCGDNLWKYAYIFSNVMSNYCWEGTTPKRIKRYYAYTPNKIEEFNNCYKMLFNPEIINKPYRKFIRWNGIDNFKAMDHRTYDYWDLEQSVTEKWYKWLHCEKSKIIQKIKI